MVHQTSASTLISNTGVPVGVPAALLPVQFRANVPWMAVEDDPNVWVPATLRGYQNEVPGSWLWPDLNLTIRSIKRSERKMEYLSVLKWMGKCSNILFYKISFWWRCATFSHDGCTTEGFTGCVNTPTVYQCRQANTPEKMLRQVCQQPKNLAVPENFSYPNETFSATILLLDNVFLF